MHACVVDASLEQQTRRQKMSRACSVIPETIVLHQDLSSLFLQAQAT
jgi:hypothetical protein